MNDAIKEIWQSYYALLQETKSLQKKVQYQESILQQKEQQLIELMQQQHIDMFQSHGVTVSRKQLVKGSMPTVIQQGSEHTHAKAEECLACLKKHGVEGVVKPSIVVDAKGYDTNQVAQLYDSVIRIAEELSLSPPVHTRYDIHHSTLKKILKELLESDDISVQHKADIIHTFGVSFYEIIQVKE